MNESIQKLVIERNYTSELNDLDDEVTQEEKSRILKALDFQEYLQTLPFTVNDESAAEFDKMVVACDKIAKEFSGKLQATVDYQSHEANIRMECVYIEFLVGEFMDTLREIATKALRVDFQPLTSGFLRVDISMPYFEYAKP